MPPLPASVERSLFKSRGRRRALYALNSVTEAYLGELARMVGVTSQRMRGILFGHLPYYRPDLALVTLGLVAVEETEGGRLFRITRDGRRKARSLVKRMSRGQPVGP